MATYADSVSQAMSLSETLKPQYLANFKSALDAVAPGASGQIASNLSSLMKGELPADVLAQVRRNAAEMNIGQGRFGQAATSSMLGKIGATSLDLMTKGMTMTKAFMPDMPNIQALISGVQQGKEFDINAALGMGKLAEGAREFDISSQLDRSKLDLQKYGMDVSNQQFQSTLASNMALQREKTALEKFQLQLQANQATAQLAQRAKEFNANLEWDKTTSKWSKDFENFALSEKARLMNAAVAQKESVASKTAQAAMPIIQGTGAQGVTVGTGGGYMGTEAERAAAYAYEQKSKPQQNVGTGDIGFGKTGEGSFQIYNESTDTADFRNYNLFQDAESV